ncbi:ABC transporter substrate-binding protein [Paraburkholderia sediminicola]|uniref:ABC transporter substrate-binding protein n=1 Tax=Paraburkholderia sediminicola TaxID=458836 RepID=UPI0038BC7716
MFRLINRVVSSATRGLATVGVAAALVAVPRIASADTQIKMVLNWKYEGPQAWFFLAQDKGYFKAQGLDVQFDQGEGSGASIPKVAAGAYQAGFGDLNAIVELAAKEPAQAPIAVDVLYNTPPFAIVVKKDSPINTPKDLEGRTIGAPANDGALKLFPAFAKLAQIDISKVTVTNMAPNLREQMLQRGQVDAVFGYVTTVTFSAKAMGIDPSKKLRFIRYGDHGMDLYSNTVFFSRSFVKDHPEAVRGFLVALNHAIRDVIANPDAGVDAVMKREPLLKRDVEKEKLLATMRNDMSHPEIARIGLGDVDQARLKRDIAIVVDAAKLPRTPTPAEIFDGSFLPPRADRPSSL